MGMVRVVGGFSWLLPLSLLLGCAGEVTLPGGGGAGGDGSGSGGSGGGDGSDIGDDPIGPIPTGADQVTYFLGGRVLRLDIDSGTIEDFSARLDRISGGDDEAPAMAKNGEWIVLTTSRFGCPSWGCLAAVRTDLSSAGEIVAGGELLFVDGRAAISSDGNTVVYAGDGGPNSVDLFAVTRAGSAWSAPTLLTGASSAAYHNYPVLSFSGTRVLFDCGPDPYGQDGTNICEVRTDGTGFRVVVDSSQPPGGGSGTYAVHHADYGADGSVVFEADWRSEQVWVKSAAGDYSVVNNGFSNDNSPCRLPDGRFASLWLGRPGGSGVHELKIMSADGQAHSVLTPGVDIADIGMSCSAAEE